MNKSSDELWQQKFQIAFKLYPVCFWNQNTYRVNDEPAKSWAIDKF